MSCLMSMSHFRFKEKHSQFGIQIWYSIYKFGISRDIMVLETVNT